MKNNFFPHSFGLIWIYFQPFHPASYRSKLILLDQKKLWGKLWNRDLQIPWRPQTRTSEVLGTPKNRCCLKKCRNPGGHAIRPRLVFPQKLWVWFLLPKDMDFWYSSSYHVITEDSGSPSPKSLTAAPLETTKGSGLANNSWTKGHPPPPTPADKFIGGPLSLNISCQTTCQP